jgi:hypothetical protein
MRSKTGIKEGRETQGARVDCGKLYQEELSGILYRWQLRVLQTCWPIFFSEEWNKKGRNFG